MAGLGDKGGFIITNLRKLRTTRRLQNGNIARQGKTHLMQKSLGEDVVAPEHGRSTHGRSSIDSDSATV